MGGRTEDPVNAHFTYTEETYYNFDTEKKTRRRVTCDRCGESKVFANVGRMRMHLSGDAEIVKASKGWGVCLSAPDAIKARFKKVRLWP
jgi:ribosomal protein S27AE